MYQHSYVVHFRTVEQLNCSLLYNMERKHLLNKTNIDGVHGDNDIVSMWKQKTVAHIDFCNTNIAFDNAMTVYIFEMKAVIDDLASNKSHGLDGLSAEHFRFAHSWLLTLMPTQVSSIVVHGNVPHSVNESVIVHTIKDKNKRVNDNICSKIIEVVIFNRIGTFLQSSANQFGFKPKHGTELCVFAFKELLRFLHKKTWFCHACRLIGCLEGF